MFEKNIGLIFKMNFTLFLWLSFQLVCVIIFILIKGMMRMHFNNNKIIKKNLNIKLGINDKVLSSFSLANNISTTNVTFGEILKQKKNAKNDWLIDVHLIWMLGLIFALNVDTFTLMSWTSLEISGAPGTSIGWLSGNILPRVPWKWEKIAL